MGSWYSTIFSVAYLMPRHLACNIPRLFHRPLHSCNGRQTSWHQECKGLSVLFEKHSHEPTMHCSASRMHSSLAIPISILKLANISQNEAISHTHWHSYSHQHWTVYQSTTSQIGLAPHFSKHEPSAYIPTTSHINTTLSKTLCLHFARNTRRPEQNGQHFADANFKCIY